MLMLCDVSVMRTREEEHVQIAGMHSTMPSTAPISGPLLVLAPQDSEDAAKGTSVSVLFYRGLCWQLSVSWVEAEAA